MRYMAMILTLCIFLGVLGAVTPTIAQETKTEALLMYEVHKKAPWIGVGAAFLLPTLGHVYAEDWWPRGAKFLAFYVGSIVLIANENTAPIGVLTLVGCRIWEYVDAYRAVEDYNWILAKRLGVELSLHGNKPYLHLCYRF